MRRSEHSCRNARWIAAVALLGSPVARADGGDAVARASIIVMRAVATAAAVDPVETQRQILLSRTFLASVPAVPGAPDLRAAVELRRLGRSAVLELRARGRTRDQAQKICTALVGAAVSAAELVHGSGVSFLAEQSRTLAAEVKSAEAALVAFKKRHGLLAVSLADRQAMASRLIQTITERKVACRLDRHCTAAKSSELERALDEAKRDALELNLHEVEHDRLRRALEIKERLRSTLEQRLSERRLGQLLDPDLRLLDPCAPL